MEAIYKTHQFPNGIRLIHRHHDSAVAHFGMIVQTGTRDEEEAEHGLAHFIEHMFFKGTERRTAFQIISRLEDVGGDINAYTTKEETAIHASFLRQDYRRAVDLIHELFISSTFSIRERRKEIDVIISEIQSYEDSPSELIFDDAEELLYPGQSIGRNILGTRKSLKKFQNGMVENFFRENYSTDEIVLCSLGSVDFSKLVMMISRTFGEIPLKSRIRPRIRPFCSNGQQLTVRKRTHQTHCILITEGYDLHHEDRLALHLLNNILGGPGMNSRLNLALRERRGYSYSAESHYAPYTDTGALAVYFSCDREKFDSCYELAIKEIRSLSEKDLTPGRLTSARKQIIGQLAISSDIPEHLLLTMGKSYQLFHTVDSLEDIRMKLEQISAARLKSIARQVFEPERLNTLIYT
ncbi:MAG: M16 family metallopeptidase [Bacteroidota bacterium]